MGANSKHPTAGRSPPRGPSQYYSLEGRDQLVGASRLHQEALPLPEGRTGACPRHKFSERSETGALAQADIERCLITHDEPLEDTLVLIVLDELYLVDGLHRDIA